MKRPSTGNILALENRFRDVEQKAKEAYQETEKSKHKQISKSYGLAATNCGNIARFKIAEVPIWESHEYFLKRPYPYSARRMTWIDGAMKRFFEHASKEE